jgi:uncharacterized phage protein (TIGR02220 family)
MARPLKYGFDYFSLDCHFDDEVELLEAECGLEGFAILIKLWQKIYANGYYIDWNDDVELLFSKKINTDRNKVISVINACLLRNLFNKSMYQKYKILTSSGIQKRYITSCVVSKRTAIIIDERFLLVNGDYKRLITELIPFVPEKTTVNPSESTQEKVIESNRIEKKEEDSIYCAVINYLNQTLDTKYKTSSNKNKSLINARMDEGFTLEDFKTVIQKKSNEWNNTDMQKYLRPETLFGTKFEGYLNERSVKKQSQNIFLDMVKEGGLDEQD